MAEHSPAATPHRAVYGFAFYLFFHVLFIVYVLWAYLPTDALGLTYLPDKYFLVFIPMVTLMGMFFFEFFIYPGINMTMTPDIDDLSSVLDVNLLQNNNNHNSKTEFSWQRVQTSEMFENPNLDASKLCEMDYCELCQKVHQASKQKPIASLRFIDLAEMNYEIFG